MLVNLNLQIARKQPSHLIRDLLDFSFCERRGPDCRIPGDLSPNTPFFCNCPIRWHLSFSLKKPLWNTAEGISILILYPNWYPFSPVISIVDLGGGSAYISSHLRKIRLTIGPPYFYFTHHLDSSIIDGDPYKLLQLSWKFTNYFLVINKLWMCKGVYKRKRSLLCIWRFTGMQSIMCYHIFYIIGTSATPPLVMPLFTPF